MRAALGAVLLCACGSAFPAPPQTLRFETLSVEQGLAQESVTVMLQDRDGFLWLGSQAGLARFDGYQTTVFRSEPGIPHSLSDNWVSALYEDVEGQLWVGTRGGLQRYDAERELFESIALEAGVGRGSGTQLIQAIIADRPGAASGALWIATGHGLYRLDVGNSETTASHQSADRMDGLPDDNVTALAWDRSGHLWVGTATTLTRTDSGGKTFQSYRLDEDAVPDSRRNEINALQVGRDGKLWIGTAAGLEVWQLGGGEPLRRRFGAEDGFPESDVQTLLQDRQGQVWVGTRTEGLLSWDPDRARFLRYRHHRGDAHSLADDNINSLLQDRTGTLWVGTRTGGASRVDLSSGGFDRYGNFDVANGLRDSNKIYSISGDSEGALWLASLGGGVHRFIRATGQTRNFRRQAVQLRSLPDDTVSAVHVDRVGRTWVGTDRGLARLDPQTGQFEAVRLFNAQPYEEIRRIASDSRSILWLGTADGLIRYEPETGAAQAYRHDPDDPRSFGFGRVHAMHFDRKNRFWIGTDSGLHRMALDGLSFEHYLPDPSRSDALFSGRISHIMEDSKGRLWVGTASGLHRLDDPTAETLRFRRYGRAQGLGADPIGASLEDASGQIWVSTTAGLSRLNPESGSVRNYGAADGLVDGGYFVGSAHQSSDGRMYFGGISGLTAFHPEAISENSVPPVVAITGLQLFSRSLGAGHFPEGVRFDLPIHKADALVLPHQQSTLSIEFAALHYADPRRNRYAYRMLGLDSEWVETGASRRYVTYSNLAPGDYEFEVKAANKDGVWSPEPRRLSVSVLPPWWATWWARGGALLLVALALWTAYRLRMRFHTRQRALLAQEVDARTAEVVRQKDDIEQINRNLSVLAEIGREITATLDQAAVVATLDRHVHGLLDATTFVIYRLDDGGQNLSSVLRVEDSEPLPNEAFAVDDPVRHAARCARERSELLMNWTPEDEDPSQVAGTLNTLSAMFAPLAIGDRLLGVMTIQSPREHAYGERERVIFRSLCAYGAIALDNSASYRKLHETDQRLLRLSAEQQLILDYVSAAVFLVKDGVIARCNRGMEEILGYGPGELLGQSPEIYFPTAEIWEAQNAVTNAQIGAGEVADGENEVVRKDGQRIWVYYRGRAVNPQDLEQGSIWVAHDISETKRAAAELERIRREQQIIFDNLSGGIMFTKDRTVVRCNRGVEDFLGFEPGTLAGQSVGTYFPSAQAFQEYGEYAYPILKAGGVVQGEVIYRHRDGELIPAFVSGRALDSEDLSQGVVWMAQDIRQQKRDAAELDRARRELQIIFENEIGAISVTRNRRMQRCSRGFVSLFGYTEAQAVGMPVHCFAADPSAAGEQYERSMPKLAAGQVVSGEFRYRRKDGASGWLLYQGRALEPPDLDQGVLWLCQDISALKDQEQQLRLSKSQVEVSLVKVEQLNHQVSTLGELSGFLQACPNAEEAFCCIVEFGPRLFAGSSGVLYLAEDEGGSWVEQGRWGDAIVGSNDRFGSSDCWALRRSRPYCVDTPSEALCCLHLREREPRPYACLPLTAQGKTFGLLHIEHAHRVDEDGAQHRFGIAVALAEQIALAIANVQLREVLLQQSLRDPLTGLYNRRHMEEILFGEVGRCRHEGLALAVLMVDVDHFKRCNDNFGHPAGDYVLKHVAQVLESALRARHVACRYGGEEFLVLLPGCDLEGGTRVAEQILQGVRALVLSHENQALDRTAVSIGMALYPQHGSSPEALVGAADAALYAAKEAGRDRLVVNQVS